MTREHGYISQRLPCLLTALALGLGLCAVAHADPPPGRGYALAFDEPFSAGPDASAWGLGYPWGAVYDGRACMLASQVQVADGALVLTAIPQRSITDPNGYWDFPASRYIPFDVTSGAVNTYGRRMFHTGYFEGRFLLPSASSAWPRFRLVQDGWPPQVDILSAPCGNARYGFLFSSGGTRTAWTSRYPAPGPGWHTFGLEWTPSSLVWYLDGQLQARYSGPAVGQLTNACILIDLQSGGAAADPVPADFLAALRCDWVRVWQTTYPPATDIFRLTPKLAPWTALEVANSQNVNGAPLAINAAAFTPNQRWRMALQADETYKIIPYAGSSTKIVDLNAWNTANGAVIDLWEDDGGANLKWMLQEAGGGWYRIVSAVNTAKCMQVKGAAPGNGTGIELWDVNGSDNQLWRLDPADVPPPGDVTNDGTVDAQDAAAILRATAGLSTLAWPGAGDVAPNPSADPRGYGDGRLDISDAVRVLRAAAGLEASWP